MLKWLSIYCSEWTAAVDSWPNFYRMLSASMFILVSSVIPAITFASYLGQVTGGEFGVTQVLFSTGLSGMIYSIFAGQPLIIMGVTGPIALFSRSIYQLSSSLGIDFLTFMLWIGLWAGVFHIITGVLGFCRAVKYVSRFTHETFGALIAVVYIYTAFAEMGRGFAANPLSASLLAVLLTLGTFLVAELLANIRYSSIYNLGFRTLVGDYSLIVSLIIMTLIPRFLSLESEKIALPALQVALNFVPSNGRTSWFVDPLANPTWAIFAAIPPAILLSILIFFDHNVASMISQDPQFGLKRTPSYDHDFIVVGVTMLVTSVLGLPPTHGLLPQAPLHTLHLARVHEEITFDNETNQQIKRKVYSDVLEQRLSNMLQSTITFGLLFWPSFLSLLGKIPISVLGGTFLVLGYQSVMGNTFVERFFVKLFVTDANLRSMAAPHCWPVISTKLLGDSTRRFSALKKIYLFTALQLAFLVVIFYIMEFAPPYVALTFPVFITMMIAVPFILKSPKMGNFSFTEYELGVLQDEKIKDEDVHLTQQQNAVTELDLQESFA